MRNRIVASVIALLAVGFAVCPAHSQGCYGIKDLGNVIPADINKYGEVVGCRQNSDYNLSAVYCSSSGKTINLQNYLCGQESRAFAINDNHQIAGYCLDTSSEWLSYGFLCQPWKYMKTIATMNLCFSINNAGTIVGNVNRGTQQYGAVLKNGILTILPPLPGCYDSGAAAINKYGLVVGYSSVGELSFATIWVKGVPESLHPADATWSFASAINDKNQIVGKAEFNSADFKEPVYRALYWNNSPEAIFLSDFGTDSASARDINNLGQIVGQARRPDGSYTAVTWKNGVINDLGKVVPPYWTVDSAMAVNDLGQIAITGYYRNTAHGGVATPK